MSTKDDRRAEIKDEPWERFLWSTLKKRLRDGAGDMKYDDWKQVVKLLKYGLGPIEVQGRGKWDKEKRWITFRVQEIGFEAGELAKKAGDQEITVDQFREAYASVRSRCSSLMLEKQIQPMGIFCQALP